MPNNTVILEDKSIKDINGTFFIPAYQRGYRWTDKEVTRLLHDVSKCDKIDKYWLQPIVIKKREDGKFELIDGQQRLTSIYLIYKFLSDNTAGSLKKDDFSIEYENERGGVLSLNKLDFSKMEEDINSWFACSAYESIQKWFDKNGGSATYYKIANFLAEKVYVIWYEVDSNEDSNELFKRLNIGKIALTSAELVKALFLSANNQIEGDRQKEISLLWDSMEHDLHRDDFWFFLTNAAHTEYQTKIDLILDLISQKSADEIDEYHTFFYFDKLSEEGKLKKAWDDILNTYYMLKGWFEDHELYHKIGYLVSSKAKTLRDIYNLAFVTETDADGNDVRTDDRINKDKFIQILDNEIRESVKTDENFGSMSYNRNSAEFEKLLLLFNVISVWKNGEQTAWFPFSKLKFNGKEKVIWSLEHIHAQNSEGLENKESAMRSWLEDHIEVVRRNEPSGSTLSTDIEVLAKKTTIKRDAFNELFKKVFSLMSSSGSIEYMHSISNMALLDVGNNAALSNSVFGGKRDKIIEMDKDGEFIPFCTKMVFLKYYTKSENNQLDYWGENDRNDYVDNINQVLKDYIEPIELQAPEE